MFIDKTIKQLLHWLKPGLVSVLLMINISVVHADENLLHIKPARCIALHEGQVCYQTLNINWQAERADNYCLYQQDSKTPLICWENLASGKGVYEFESSSTRKFILMRKNDSLPVAEFSIEVAWVYDSSTHRESHWRIF